MVRGPLVTVSTIPFVTLEAWTGRASHDAWRRIDVVYDLTNGEFKVHVDGILRSVAGGVTQPAPPAAQFGHHASQIGGLQSDVTNDLELDVDDWFNAEKPPTFDGLDWRHGSKVVHVRPKAFHAHHDAAGWPGDVRVLAQDAIATSPLGLSWTTPSAVCAVETNADQVVGRDGQAMGSPRSWCSQRVAPGRLAAARLRARRRRPGDRDARLGLINAYSTGLLFSQQAGSVDPLPPILPLELPIVKGADAALNKAQSLSAQVEVLGRYTACDGSASDASGPGGGGGPSCGPGSTRAGRPSIPRMPGARRPPRLRGDLFSLIGKTEGSDASDWVAVLTGSGIPTGLAAGVVPTDSMPYFALTRPESGRGACAGGCSCRPRRLTR